MLLPISQEIVGEECLRDDLFCVEWGLKPSQNQSINVTLESANVTWQIFADTHLLHSQLTSNGIRTWSHLLLCHCLSLLFISLHFCHIFKRQNFYGCWLEIHVQYGSFNTHTCSFYSAGLLFSSYSTLVWVTQWENLWGLFKHVFTDQNCP